ncbi:MAG: type IVB secretion system coupling complex protein DotM/IcmP [Legionellales bacterium]|nr:type IVB secretion system coupling complex protein DotM/IcmP [Legionellales bacterium]
MAQQSQQQSGDNSMAPIWIAVLLFLTLYFVWALGHKFIVSFVFTLNIWEAKLINLFIGVPQLANEIELMQTLNPSDVDWNQLMLLTHIVGSYARYPVIAVLILLAGLLYKSDITLKFRRSHDMLTLRAQEQYNWPSIMPVVKQDLVATDINTGPWAMAMSPLEFSRKYELLKKKDILLDDPEVGQEMTAGIRRGDAKRVFTLQLGPYWSGFEHCPPHAQALAAVFISRMNRDRASATKILEFLDKSRSEGKLDFSIATPILKKHQNSEMVQEILSKHAYLLTVMASLLLASRDDGVMPSAEFLWLKPFDRRLWYMLNCVGRQTPFSEISGPFAHWRAEKAMGRRSLVPMIDEAIKALEVAIKEIKLSPKELQGLTP